ncbi:MAG TPA: hypothetical protein DDX39_00310 [Bacteroidales bacterium]|nr:MAG: hypothetical protein A2W98_03245 [Bacteroidetes bacterium GWF2_33_38]OFY72297.1 MAG: hypothetical protein A2265_12175 [Bacteroidetes bacterium RIFOXYA12_FULL_33_9]HBF87052.1 hypothetical protein [Bacteroidales bacterium]
MLMFNHSIITYIKVALRNLIRYKYYSIINISSLTIGLAAFLLISLFVKDETGFDKYHKNANRIYRVTSKYDNNGVGEIASSVAFPVGPTLEKELPTMISKSARFFNFQMIKNLVEYKDKSFNEKHFFFADSSALDIFDYKFIRGNSKTALDKPFSVIITESIAKKYFNEENPIGKQILSEKKLNLTITGVIKDIPLQSHFRPDFIASMSTVRYIFRGMLPDNWVWNPCWTYILLNENVSPEEIKEKLPGIISTYMKKEKGQEHFSLSIQPLTDIHLKSKLDYEISPNGNILYVKILSAIALFLILIACINYAKLATVISAKRAKETAIRKIHGANKWQLAALFLSEAVLLSFISLAFALVIVELSIPSFNQFTGKNIDLGEYVNAASIFFMIGISFLVGLLSGLYPTIYMITVKPLKIFRTNTKIENKSSFARKTLVVLQFTISIIVTIGTIITFQQLSFLRNTSLGFEKENIYLLPIEHTPILANYELFKADLLKNKNIESITATEDILGINHNTHEYIPHGKGENDWTFVPTFIVRYDFIKTFGIQLIAGRDYIPGKDDEKSSIIVNEALVEHMGWKSNQEAIGKKFKSLFGDEKIIGVVRNFNVTSLHSPKVPFVIDMKEYPAEISQYTRYISFKIRDKEELKETLDYVTDKWINYCGNRPFEYMSLEDELSELYIEEETLGKTAAIFSILIILIATTGLIGLSSFLIHLRTKEVCIRRVLGASTFSIVKTISAEFIYLIILANAIAAPISYWGISVWLESFDQHVDISALPFIFAGVISLLISLIITAYQAVKTTKTELIDSLKYE